MRYGILADIHSNLEALQQAVSSCRQQGIDKFISLGDMVGYGATPCQCLKLLAEIKTRAIAGNHDWGVTGKINQSYFNWQARQALAWTRKKLNKKNWQYLRSLPLTYAEGELFFVHASLNNPRQFDYMLDSRQAEVNFSLLKQQICFIGHSHRPGAFSRDEEGRIKYLKPAEINIEENKKYIINAGSVGQPRDGDCRLCFCIYDRRRKTVQFKRLSYNIKAASDKIAKNGLPHTLAQRLYAGL